jgi:hypothetical protein
MISSKKCLKWKFLPLVVSVIYIRFDLKYVYICISYVYIYIIKYIHICVMYYVSYMNMYVIVIHVLLLVIISLIAIYVPRFVLTWFFPLHGMSFPQQFSIKPWKHNKNNETPMNEIHLLRNSVPERTCAHPDIYISTSLFYVYSR